ncbi:molecular chaperone DnaJ [Mobilicoccus pelagius]|uniref:Chaperone protein DnaJ n=1 Tax=Mobilicoccus pelagius NBRC 104925 TaxID=1089455 RepID=H5UPW7_9MICO|nr:molecular chaperone DnaJ [Mobilicoccus pelagius]GAB47772.1 chaperone protein DnaJ [Mobilicoccus pelagius NBRC 104925]
MNDYYADLGVSREATAEEIKRAYRRKARKLHPDVNPGPEAEAEFKKVSQAYDVLGDPAKKQQYDMGADPYGGMSGSYGQGFSFTDIMDAFFGGAATASRGPRSRVQRGQDALIRVDIDLETAVFGGDQEVVVDTAVVCETCHGDGKQPGTGTRTCDICGGRGEVQQVQRSFLGQVMTSRPCTACHGFGEIITDPCFDCSGNGRVRTRRTLTLAVPAGVDTGTRIQLAGEGEVGPGGGTPGDLYVEVQVKPHEKFQRRGDDLHCVVEVPMTAAALGTVLEFDTLDGPTEFTVKPGAQSGEVTTIKDHGVTHLRGSGRGDLLVTLRVVTPTKLDHEQEELMRRLAEIRGEKNPSGRVSHVDSGGLFGKLRDAFLGK